MIPYIGATTYSFFGLTFQVWGTIVALGYGLGTYLAYRRARAKGLDGRLVLDMAFWIFIGAFVGSRLFHVFVYEPQYYLQHPWEAIDLRLPGYAIFGGFLGAFVVFMAFVKRHALSFFAYADVLIWGLPWGCGVGRLGCFLIHDHPGTLSDSLLAMRYPDGMSRHDLGLYLSLIGFATGILFLCLNRRVGRPGFWFGLYLVIEAISRFSLDFLRITDVRYLRLTPAQWLSIPLLGIGLWLLRAREHTRSISSS